MSVFTEEHEEIATHSFGRYTDFRAFLKAAEARVGPGRIPSLTSRSDGFGGWDPGELPQLRRELQVIASGLDAPAPKSRDGTEPLPEPVQKTENHTQALIALCEHGIKTQSPLLICNVMRDRPARPRGDPRKSSQEPAGEEGL